MISHHLATLAATTTCPVPKETGSGFFGPIAKPIATVLAAFYHLVPSYGFAILLLSVVWMVIISPLTLKSTRSMLAMQKIQPEIKKLQEKHKNDRQAFAQAQMDLFKERGVSPFGSCLPTLLPLPVFFALFRVIDGLSHTTKGCATPQYLSPSTKMYHNIVAGHGTLHSFGLDLAKNALSSHSSFLAALPFFVLLLVMGGTQYLQTQQMMSRNPAAADNPQMKMMKYLPIIFTVICIRFPAGVVLYYSMSNVCRIAQQSLMYRYDPKVRTLAKRDVIDVEAFTEEHEEEHRRQRGKGSPGPASGNGGAGGGSPRGGGSKGGSGGGGSGGGLAKRDEPEDAKPARSRFSALFEAAKEQKAQQLEEKSKAKQQARQPASNRSTPRQGKGGGAPAKGGGSPAKPATKPPAKAKSAGGANGAQGSSGGRGPANGNGSATPAKASNGNGNGNGNGAKTGPPPRTNGGAGRTGAANRTGARSGAKKNRRGR